MGQAVFICTNKAKVLQNLTFKFFPFAQARLTYRRQWPSWKNKPWVLIVKTLCFNGLHRWNSGKESACQCRRYKRHGFHPLEIVKIPWRREWQLTPIFLPGKFCEQRSLTVYSPWGHKESDMTEPVHANTYVLIKYPPVTPKCCYQCTWYDTEEMLLQWYCSQIFVVQIRICCCCVCVQCIEKISVYFRRLRFHTKEGDSSLANFY